MTSRGGPSLVVGIVLALVGLVWLGQGVGLIGGSFMSGSMTWAVIGLICLLVGAILAGRALGISRRH